MRLKHRLWGLLDFCSWYAARTNESESLLIDYYFSNIPHSLDCESLSHYFSYFSGTLMERQRFLLWARSVSNFQSANTINIEIKMRRDIPHFNFNISCIYWLKARTLVEILWQSPWPSIVRTWKVLHSSCVKYFKWKWSADINNSHL